MTVKVPTGMGEPDLARPVVEIRDFETGKLDYEIYTFGEENIVIPVKEKKSESAMKQLAKQRIRQIINKYDPDAEIEFISGDKVKVIVDNDVISRLIGKGGSNINEIEKKLINIWSNILGIIWQYLLFPVNCFCLFHLCQIFRMSLQIAVDKTLYI